MTATKISQYPTVDAVKMAKLAKLEFSTPYYIVYSVLIFIIIIHIFFIITKPNHIATNDFKQLF